MRSFLLLCLCSCLFFFAHFQLPEGGIDFSYAGYEAGVKPLPQVPAVLRVKPSGADDTRMLQAAIHAVGAMPVQANGYRGALELEPGTYRISGQLKVNVDGVVLRGRSQTARTVLLATGTGRRHLLVLGAETVAVDTTRYALGATITPAGAITLPLANTAGLAVGDAILLTRPSTRQWISSLGMDSAKGAFADMRIHWTPGSRDIRWYRSITAMDSRNQTITLDAPITTALDPKYGGGWIQKTSMPLHRIGIENLDLQSAFDPQNPIDEDHSWTGIYIGAAADVFVRNTVFRHFAGSALIAGPLSRRVTVEGCRNLAPVSEVGGYRRHSFVVEGSQVLVKNCFAEKGINDFATGFCAAGPNVFLNCKAVGALDASGAFESWASGILYEQVHIKGAGLHIGFDRERTQGSGWTAANSVVWNCSAKDFVTTRPDGAPNLLYSGKESLYYNQLSRRKKPATASFASRVQTQPKWFRYSGDPATPPATAHPLAIINGRFVLDGKTVWGGSLNDAWWMGQSSPAAALDAGVSITRFMPGKWGHGHTEILADLADTMLRRNMPFSQTGAMLWYDRRRDDHTIEDRASNHVWAPFYELPWARSGKGKAWDGLSRYDLNRFNKWYFERHREWAGLAITKGFVVYHSLYNTHNLLEIGAHWCDYPWRPANTLSQTGLPEPMPLEPNNRLHLANEFYSTNNPGQKKLHQLFIKKVLDEMGGNPNVIWSVGFQYAGPLAFQEFFLREAAAWQRTNKKPLRIALATSKDITDAILGNPELEPLVSVVDMRYWQYRPDGSLWAPPGGKNLAFREMTTKEFKRSSDAAPSTTPLQAYRQVREYRDRFPAKALVVWHNGVGGIPALMGGAAQVLNQNPTAGHSQGRITDRTGLDAFVQENLASVLHRLAPVDGLLENPEQAWAMQDQSSSTFLLYSLNGNAFVWKEKTLDGNYKATWYHEATNTRKAAMIANPGKEIPKPDGSAWLLLLEKVPG